MLPAYGCRFSGWNPLSEVVHRPAWARQLLNTRYGDLSAVVVENAPWCARDLLPPRAFVARVLFVDALSPMRKRGATCFT